MKAIQDPENMRKLNLNLPREGQLPLKDEHVQASSTLRDQVQILELFTNLCVEIASARCWSQAIHFTTIPNLLASVHHVDIPEREMGMWLMKKMWTAVLHAERVVADLDTTGSVRDKLRWCLQDMGWPAAQLSREAFQVMHNGGWLHADHETRRLSWLIFGNPANTKHHLEDVFSHLADLTKRMGKKLRMTKWLACTFGLLI